MISLGLIGFGRVGRTLLRVLLQRERAHGLVCLTELNPAGRDAAELTANLAYLLAHDSTYGPLPATVSARGDRLLVDGREIRCFYSADPAQVDWAAAGVRVVVEASGDPAAAQAAASLLQRGVAKVVFTRSAPVSHATLVRGINLDQYDPARHHLVSCSTCTANALAPVLSVLHRAFGVSRAGVTTVHPALSGDTLLDRPAAEFALGRSGLGVRAAASGIADTAGKLLPELAGRISAMSLRVPTASVNAIVADILLERPPASTAAVVDQLEQAAAGDLAGVMRLEPGFLGRARAAEDFKADPHSAVVDLCWLELAGPLLRLVIWHDNEWAYCQRVADVIDTVSASLG